MVTYLTPFIFRLGVGDVCCMKQNIAMARGADQLHQRSPSVGIVFEVRKPLIGLLIVPIMASIDRFNCIGEDCGRVYCIHGGLQGGRALAG